MPRSSVTGNELRALHSLRVDRNSPIPLYFQVSQHLEKAIASGTIPNGALLGGEIELAQQLGLSRPTVRQAMDDLVDKGLIVRRRGIGTRVVQPKVRRPLELTSLHDDLRASGQAPRTEVLDLGWVAATDVVAEQLAVRRGTQVQRLVRLRLAGDLPIAILTNFLPDTIGEIGEDDLRAYGLYELMRERGFQLHSATQTVGARNATPEEAAQLGEPEGAALLTMQRTTHDDRGQVVEYGTHLYAASRYSFETNLLAT